MATFRNGAMTWYPELMVMTSLGHPAKEPATMRFGRVSRRHHLRVIADSGQPKTLDATALDHLGGSATPLARFP